MKLDGKVAPITGPAGGIGHLLRPAPGWWSPIWTPTAQRRQPRR